MNEEIQNINIIDESDLELKLLANVPIEIINVGKIHSLKLKQIVELGYSVYNQYLSSLCFNIEDLKKQFSEEVDLSNLTTFDVISSNCIHDENYKDLILKSFSLFFNEKVEFIDEYKVFYLGDIENPRLIFRDNYEIIKKVLRLQNCLKEKTEDEFNPANNKARELIEKIKRNRAESANLSVKRQEENNLYSIISGTAWKSHIGIYSVWDFTIYQLYDAYARLELIDTRDKTLNGVYAGTVDSKEVNFKDLSWIKYFKINN